MKAVILLLIGLLAGAMMALATANVLAMRGAHPRAVMVLLERHVDGLRALPDEAGCTGPEGRVRLGQVRFAAREIDFGFRQWRTESPAFGRRSDAFQALAGRLDAPVSDCADLHTRLTELERGCQDCHRDFR